MAIYGRLDVMASYTTIIFLLAGLSFALSSPSPRPTEEECEKKPHEYLDPCGNCERTCEDPFPNCRNSPCGGPGCLCEFGYSRIANGSCIPNRSCPNACPDGEYWSDCGNCEPTCDNPYPSCDVSECKAQCACVPSEIRDVSGKCVGTYECNSNPCWDKTCNDNEMCVNVVNDCTPYGCHKKPVCVETGCLAELF
ncbi:hypothetical protein QR680_006655 [Steinernema hermaphroditum]|uniref:TIL domain-containing protein n=1 Tax=Steinernema hermaphroditum TaxID=289476 RepID=A0AA39HXD0_9BILA|nr:hypothetical protein QR680_006655 [Steinernema hermaphroditum]